MGYRVDLGSSCTISEMEWVSMGNSVVLQFWQNRRKQGLLSTWLPTVPVRYCVSSRQDRSTIRPLASILPSETVERLLVDPCRQEDALNGGLRHSHRGRFCW